MRGAKLNPPPARGGTNSPRRRQLLVDSCHVRPRSSPARARKFAQRQLARSLGEPTVKDPHCLHCHECGTIAEFGLRGSKEGGEVRYFCSAHASNGCFCIDKDRAVSVQHRAQRRLKAKLVRLEEELQQMDEASSSAEPAKPTCCLPDWDEANFKVALPSTKPISRLLLKILLMIGCVESNPGPSSDGMDSSDSASALVPPLSQMRQSAGTPMESRGGDSSTENSGMEESGGPSIEADSQGEDIEDVEFNREEESSDEETSQDRQLLDDSSQPPIAPVWEYARMDAELGLSDTESEIRFYGGRKRAKRVESDQSAESQPRGRGRRRVIMSSSSEAEAEAEANESGSEGGGQSATSSGWGELRNDDDPTRDWDDEREFEEMREYFGVCRIDPCSERDRGESLASQAVFQHGQSMAPVALTRAAAAGPSVQDAFMPAPSIAATSAVPTRATSRVVVRETTPSSQGPSRAVEASAQVQTGSPSQVDPILAAAHYFHGLGIVTITHDLKEIDDKGKIRKVPCRWPTEKSWKQANLSNCLQEFAKPGRNSIAIVTERSDIYAVDVDVKDGGFDALEQMVDEHDNFPEDTPRQTTGNGGMHVLFSLSQSQEAGLLNCSNRSRIRYKGKEVGIDVRGKGGMLYSAPSSYTGLDGTLRRYEWDHEILPDRSNLRAVPDWLISILNASGEAPTGASHRLYLLDLPRQRSWSASRPAWWPLVTTPPASIASRWAATGPCTSFEWTGPDAAQTAITTTASTTSACWCAAGPCSIAATVQSVWGSAPCQRFGELTRSEAMIGGELRAFRADDVSAIDNLHKGFVDNWAFEGDVGGSKIVAEMYASCGRLWFDGETWWYWDGRRFVQDGKGDFMVKNVLINQLRIVYERVRDEWNAAIEVTIDEKEQKALLQQLKRLRTYNNVREMSSTLELLRGELFAKDLAHQLDANPDILNVKNGVLLLRTGELDLHRPQYLCSKIAETDFMVSPSCCFQKNRATSLALELARYDVWGVLERFDMMHVLVVLSLFTKTRASHWHAC
ncbi:hypothetical protein KFL_009960010, partial [Klebsormidium nitens]